MKIILRNALIISLFILLKVNKNQFIKLIDNGFLIFA